MNEILLNLIVLIHISVILFIIIAPFTNINYILFLNAIIIPFIMFHWYLNDNTCALTLLEKHVRSKISGKAVVDDDCFTCKIIHPIYDFKKNHSQFTVFIYTTVIILWLITVFKLYYKYKIGQIKNWQDLFTF